MESSSSLSSGSEAMVEDENRLAPETKSLSTIYLDYLWSKVVTFFPNSNSPFLGKISNFYRQFTGSRSRRRRPSLPLPLPSKSLDCSLIITEEFRIYEVLETILEHVYLHLHNVQKNVRFWQSKAEGSNYDKVCFMYFERGPRAFVDQTRLLVQSFIGANPTAKHVSQSASAHIAERISILDSLRYTLARFLAQVYIEIEKNGEDLVSDQKKALPSMLITLNGLFSDLELSIGHLHAKRQIDSSVDGSYSVPLLFEKLPEVDQEGSEWTECEVEDAINLVYQNLAKLDSYLSALVTKHQQPSRLSQHWIRYTCGAVGLSVCSLWIVKHSSLVGSPDIDNWIREGKESTVSFWIDHVEHPMLSIRDELFETFRKRHKGVMEVEEVQLTANSLHRMLLSFSELTKGQKFPENASDQEMLEIVMGRYEKELTHPIQNLLGGELARALLIQVQKLKLDIETAMLELDQILRANEINFAVLAALPAFVASFLLAMLVRSWFKQDKTTEGRGRVARRYRRMLLVEVEKRILQYQNCVDLEQEEDAQFMFGLILYSLDRLYHVAEGHAKATDEWLCLRQDIIDLAKPGLPTAYKLTVTSRMERVYECLLPWSKH